MFWTAIVSLALLGHCTSSAQAASSSNDTKQCFSWWDSCVGKNYCGNLTAYQGYQNTSSELLCFVPVPSDLAPSPGDCVFVPDPVSSESGECQFVNPCSATPAACYGAQYECATVDSSIEPLQCFLSTPPLPTQPCAPANGSCEFFPDYCVKYPAFCNSGYLCGTAVEQFKYFTGPQPLCFVPPDSLPPAPPGECIYQSGKCAWSECTSWLDYCQTYWTCGTKYDNLVYYSYPPPPCPAPPFDYVPPTEPGYCQYNITAGQCQYTSCASWLDFCQTYWTCGTEYDRLVYFSGPLPACAAPPPGYTPPVEPGNCHYDASTGQCQYSSITCDDVDCSNGTVCVTNPATSVPYCQPSCDDANGGCPDDQICSLVNQLCASSSCLPQVVCSGPVSPCSDAVIGNLSCPLGSSCVVDMSTNQSYCLPSCDLSNGGCAKNEECSLVAVQCFTTPCPPQVNCTPTDNTTNPCAALSCDIGSYCVANNATGEVYCQLSCDLDNGGCEEDEQCSLEVSPCAVASCPSQVVCTPKVPICSDAAVEELSCPVGSSCAVDLIIKQLYCLPSCDLSNGGCPENQECSLIEVQCFTTPCPPQVNCTTKENTTDPCAAVLCMVGTYCVSYSAVGEVYCVPSCDIANGGCEEDETCTLVEAECDALSCLPHVVCNKTVTVDPCAVVKCPSGTYCKVDDESDDAYCQPSCDISNGGCPSDELCTLVEVQCITSLCPPQVVCVRDLCSSMNCARTERCVITDKTTSGAGSALCLPSCYADNGGCSDQVCVVETDSSCTAAPCSSLTCVRVGDYRSSGDCPSGMVYQSCGSSCPTSCDNLGIDLICTAVCVPGCFCPSGLVEYRDRCVDPLECPALLADPPELNPLPLADNEVLIQLSILNATVETFNEKKSNFLSSLWNILADSGLSDVKVELYAVMEGDDSLRSASEIIVVVEITSDMISDDGTTAEDIVTIIDRNKDSLPLSVSTVTSVTSPYEATDDDDLVVASTGVAGWIIIVIVVGVVVLISIVLIVAVVIVIFKVKRSREKLDPSSVNFSVKSSTLYGELEPDAVSLDTRNVDCDMKKDLVYKE